MEINTHKVCQKLSKEDCEKKNNVYTHAEPSVNSVE